MAVVEKVLTENADGDGEVVVRTKVAPASRRTTSSIAAIALLATFLVTTFLIFFGERLGVLTLKPQIVTSQSADPAPVAVQPVSAN